MTGTETIETAARLVARGDLSGDEMTGMYGLLSSHFDGVTREHFQGDLDEKNWVILIERAGRLVGFTSILAYEIHIDGEPISVIYSGDTIVAPEAWNSQTLPRAWIESVAGLRRAYPHGPYLWLLITSGFRTYRFLPLFWRNFFPRFDCQTPPRWKRLIEHLASERFGEQYDPATGTVKLHPQRLRRKSWRGSRRGDGSPHRVFASRNRTRRWQRAGV
jgi:hypothetical protein